MLGIDLSNDFFFFTPDCIVLFVFVDVVFAAFVVVVCNSFRFFVSFAFLCYD